MRATFQLIERAKGGIGVDQCGLVVVVQHGVRQAHRLCRIPDDNIGIGESISKLPPRILSAIFGVPAETFDKLTKYDKAAIILRKH